MTCQNSTPFFAELGKMLNLIRTICAELDDEIKIEIKNNTIQYNLWCTHKAAIDRLRGKLEELENDISYFFTGAGYRKTIDDRINTQIFRHKFIRILRILTNEHFNIKYDHSGKINTRKEKSTEINEASKILHTAMMNENRHLFQ